MSLWKHPFREKQQRRAMSAIAIRPAESGRTVSHHNATSELAIDLTTAHAHLRVFDRRGRAGQWLN
jgi:hypothetical protein